MDRSIGFSQLPWDETALRSGLNIGVIESITIHLTGGPSPDQNSKTSKGLVCVWIDLGFLEGDPHRMRCMDCIYEFLHWIEIEGQRYLKPFKSCRITWLCGYKPGITFEYIRDWATLSLNGSRTEGSASEGNSPVVSIQTAVEIGSADKCLKTICSAKSCVSDEFSRVSYTSITG